MLARTQPLLSETEPVVRYCESSFQFRHAAARFVAVCCAITVALLCLCATTVAAAQQAAGSRAAEPAAGSTTRRGRLRVEFPACGLAGISEERFFELLDLEATEVLAKQGRTIAITLDNGCREEQFVDAVLEYEGRRMVSQIDVVDLEPELRPRALALVLSETLRSLARPRPAADAFEPPSGWSEVAPTAPQASAGSATSPSLPAATGPQGPASAERPAQPVKPRAAPPADAAHKPQSARDRWLGLSGGLSTAFGPTTPLVGGAAHFRSGDWCLSGNYEQGAAQSQLGTVTARVARVRLGLLPVVAAVKSLRLRAGPILAAGIAYATTNATTGKAAREEVVDPYLAAGALTHGELSLNTSVGLFAQASFEWARGHTLTADREPLARVGGPVLGGSAGFFWVLK